MGRTDQAAEASGDQARDRSIDRALARVVAAGLVDVIFGTARAPLNLSEGATGMINEFIKGLHLPKGVHAQALDVHAENAQVRNVTLKLLCERAAFDAVCRDEAVRAVEIKIPEKGPIEKRFTFDEAAGEVTFDGARISVHVLEWLTETTPERVWFRFDRTGDRVDCTQRRDPVPEHGIDVVIEPIPPVDTSHPLVADPAMGHRLGRFA